MAHKTQCHPSEGDKDWAVVSSFGLVVSAAECLN